MDQSCLVCRKVKPESDFPHIQAGEVDQSQSPGSTSAPAQTEFKNLKHLPICRDCWNAIP